METYNYYKASEELKSQVEFAHYQQARNFMHITDPEEDDLESVVNHFKKNGAAFIEKLRKAITTSTDKIDDLSEEDKAILELEAEEELKGFDTDRMIAIVHLAFKDYKSNFGVEERKTGWNFIKR